MWYLDKLSYCEIEFDRVCRRDVLLMLMISFFKFVLSYKSQIQKEKNRIINKIKSLKTPSLSLKKQHYLQSKMIRGNWSLADEFKKMKRNKFSKIQQRQRDNHKLEKLKAIDPIHLYYKIDRLDQTPINQKKIIHI